LSWANTEQVTVEGQPPKRCKRVKSSVSQLVDRNVWQNMLWKCASELIYKPGCGAVPRITRASTTAVLRHGTRQGAGSYLVEGADNNEQGRRSATRSPNTTRAALLRAFSPDAIRNTALSPTAIPLIRQGRWLYYRHGGEVGTNQWHGSLFEYNRIQKLAAHDWESDRAGLIDHLVRTNSAFVRRPIYKNRRFSTVSAEWQRARQSVPITTTGTTQQFWEFVDNGGLAAWAESNAPVYQGGGPVGVGTVLHVYPCSMSGSISGGPPSGGASATPCPVFNRLRAVSPYPSRHRRSTGRGFWTAGLTYFDSTGTASRHMNRDGFGSQHRERERFSVKLITF